MTKARPSSHGPPTTGTGGGGSGRGAGGERGLVRVVVVVGAVADNVVVIDVVTVYVVLVDIVPVLDSVVDVDIVVGLWMFMWWSVDKT